MMMDTPPIFPGIAGYIITAIQILVVATSFSNEANPSTRTPYSKFSQANDKDSTWPSKLAMMFIYTPALIVSTTLLVLGIKDVTLPWVNLPSPSLAGVFCIVQFAKRCLEVLFLHKYSGRTDRSTPVMIGVFYACYAALVTCGAGRELYDNGSAASGMLISVGTLFFGVGIVGNFYHHYLLAKLRSSSEDGTTVMTKYVAPRGGLFEYVAAPHYLFELIGWLGIAIVSHHMNVYLVFAGMYSYLGGRSVAQNEFNRSKFDEKEWPHDRKNLIPFTF